MRLWIQLAAAAVGAAFLFAVFYAWRADRRDRNALQIEVAAARKTIDQLTARQTDRDAQLQKSLAQLAAQKNAVRTPEQALRALPEVLPLPTPLRTVPLLPAIENPSPPNPGSTDAQPKPSAPAPVVVPPEDLKPLYNFALDCQACQTRLATAQADLADERAKTAVLSRERDAALKIARGGSLWRRIGRAAKWFAIGAAVGAIAAKTAH